MQRWFQERPSPYPWEQDGLDHVRRLMPNAEPYRACATFSFTAPSGRINECDLLVAVPGGLHLVELKGHPGRVVNHDDTWLFRPPNSGRTLTLRNPLHLVDLKSKELRGRLDWAATQLRLGVGTIPRVEPSIFLSAPGLRADLDEVQRTRVYGRDEQCEGLPWIWRDLLSRPPQRESQRITPEFSRNLLALLQKAGLSVSTAHLRFGDNWTLDPELLDAGPTWEDRLAQRRDPVREQGRVRIYLTAQQAIPEVRQSVERAARREYQVLQGINHRGIVQAVQIAQHQGGPAILFRHRAEDLRLDSYLAVHGERLTPEIRLDLVRQLGEALRYAHGRSLYHRALAARSIYVSARDDGSDPVLRVIDWQAAARDFDTTGAPSAGLASAGHTSLGHTSLGHTWLSDTHLADAAEVYLAPEFDVPYADPVDLDMFGLGAVAYLIITGQPPATNRSGLIERLRAEGGLHPYAVTDGVSAALDELVHHATRADIAGRLDSPEAFLDGLDDAERDSVVPEPAGVDPLTASAGQPVDGGWTVTRVLGTGSTARALLVERTSTGTGSTGGTDHGSVTDPGTTAGPKRRVLKVALDEDRAARLHAEARALHLVGGGVVVRLLDGPRQVGGRTVLDLEYAGGLRREPPAGRQTGAGGGDGDGRPDYVGNPSLGALLRAEGRLSYHDLERFGGDLFTALDQLAGKGVRHRDLKPDNFGVFYRADRSRQLMLFDFSLAGVSERDVVAGTRGYLDPFLGTVRRSVYDDHAERYAAAVTLHEMASGERPVWGDGVTDPRTTDDEVPTLAAELFEPALRDGLTAFFHRALHRDTDRRFDTFKQMEAAWRAVFVAADATAPATTPATVGIDTADLAQTRDAHAAAADLTTPLEASGLSPRAVSVAHAFGATTVGELLGVPQHQIARARGAGALVRKELNTRHRQWTAALRGPVARVGAVASGRPTAGSNRSGQSGRVVTTPETVGPLTVEDMVELLAPPARRRGSHKQDVIRLALGLPDGRPDGPEGRPDGQPDGPDGTGVPAPWPTQTEVARRLGITPASVSRHEQTAIAQWAAARWLRDVRDELVEIVTGAGRVMTAQELAGELRARHGAGQDSTERTLARALGVVRAAVETEMWAGLHPDASVDTDSGGSSRLDGGPRLAVRRRGSRVLVALESLPGTDDPSPPELAGYAFRLGERADHLAGTDPLPGRGVVVRELRAVAPPDGLAPLADTRLVELAAAVSDRAAASPRLELYPRGMELSRALRLSQAAAGVRRHTGISVDELLARVRARFPGLVLTETSAGSPTGSPAGVLTPGRVAEALATAGFPLEYDPTDRRFRPAVPQPAWTPTSASTAMTVHARMRASGLDPAEALAGKLDAAVRRGGVLALTLRGHHLPGAAQALAAAYPVTLVDLSRVFLTELRALTTERGQDWDRVLAVDARFSRTGVLPSGLASYLRAGWERVDRRLRADATGEHTVLLVHDAGLAARYFDAGGRELLTGLQHSARRPDQAPHGLWLLCPAESAVDSPRLDGRTVEWLDASEWAALGSAFWDRLRGGTDTAA